MLTKSDELKLDIEEYNNLLKQATRQRIKDVLTLEIRRLQTQLIELASTEEKNVAPTKPAEPVANAPRKCYEVKLTNYGWDQTDSNVKLYVTLKGVHQLPKEAVTCNFTAKSLDLRVLELDNKNYNLLINNLSEEIVVKKSNVKVKTDMIVLSLAKKVPQNWKHVTAVAKKTVKDPKPVSPQDISDPYASLQNFVMKMYQEGDDDMKRELTKAWTESLQTVGSNNLNC